MQYAHAIINSDLQDLSKFIPVELNRKQISFCSSILDIQECGEINGAFTQYYRHAGIVQYPPHELKLIMSGMHS